MYMANDHSSEILTVDDMRRLMAKASLTDKSRPCSYCGQSRDYELNSYPPNWLCQYCESMCEEHNLSKTMTQAEIQEFNNTLIEKTSSKLFDGVQDVSGFTFL